MKRPIVYILTAVHDNLHDTNKFLGFIGKQNYKNIITVIVDDGSTDGTSSYLSKTKNNVYVIRGNGKLWWTGSLFLGVEHILSVANEGDYILTINTDCQFDNDYVSTLIETSKKFKDSIAGSLVIDRKSGKIWDAGVKADWKKGSFTPMLQEATINIKKHIRYGRGMNMLPTKGTLFPIEVFRKIGNFDKKNFPHYLSDYEFTYRASKKGYKLLVDYQAKVSNDTTNTGIGGKSTEEIKWKNLFSLLFSRRSRINIVDQFNIIRVSCPNKYKYRNYVLLILKILHKFLQVWPFIYIEKIVVLSKRLLKIPNDKPLLKIWTK